jgi:hypothetical protein
VHTDCGCSGNHRNAPRADCSGTPHLLMALVTAPNRARLPAGVPQAIIPALLISAIALAGCSSATASAPPSATPSASATPSESTSPTATPRPRCPVPNRGGACLGPLPAGTYTTVEFLPRITYTVPAGGWTNWEDLPGFFLLVPPGFDLAGVDAGGSDYIGIYASVVAANTDCTESEQPGVEHTAAALAAEFAQRPGLTITTPKPVSVGGLPGLVLDIRLADGWKKACFYSGGTRSCR